MFRLSPLLCQPYDSTVTASLFFIHRPAPSLLPSATAEPGEASKPAKKKLKKAASN